MKAEDGRRSTSMLTSSRREFESRIRTKTPPRLPHHIARSHTKASTNFRPRTSAPAPPSSRSAPPWALLPPSPRSSRTRPPCSSRRPSPPAASPAVVRHVGVDFWLRVVTKSGWPPLRAFLCTRPCVKMNSESRGGVRKRANTCSCSPN